MNVHYIHQLIHIIIGYMVIARTNMKSVARYSIIQSEHLHKFLKDTGCYFAKSQMRLWYLYHINLLLNAKEKDVYSFLLSIDMLIYNDGVCLQTIKMGYKNNLQWEIIAETRQKRLSWRDYNTT